MAVCRTTDCAGPTAAASSGILLRLPFLRGARPVSTGRWNPDGEKQDIAACMASLLLFLNHHHITRKELAARLIRFIRSQVEEGSVELVDYASALYFPRTRVGGKGEARFRDDVGRMQVGHTPRLQQWCQMLPHDADDKADRAAEELSGSLGMLSGLCFGESAVVGSGEPNPYYWGPQKLLRLGIVY